jgi:hypothetical protein
LEDEAAKMSKEIDKDEADRKYQLEIDSLDNSAKNFERKIQLQKEAIDKQIAKLEEEKSAYDSVSGAAGGIPDAVKEGEEQTNQFVEFLKTVSPDAKGYFEQIYNKAALLEGATQGSARAMKAFLGYLEDVLKLDMSKLNKIGSGGGYSMNTLDSPILKHSGGLIESYHFGNFAGGLKSNEVYAKLLKGEYVSTEGQMDTFIKNTLPRLSMSMATKSNAINNSSNIKFEMPITIQSMTLQMLAKRLLVK